ncbi:MAG: hypothetical protein ACI82A_002917 [Candidatus Azotimanducaceae bacterium]|jgi:hypothetical protein
MVEKGKCLCSSVSFEATVADHGIHACHCNMCRAWSSSPLFAVTAAKSFSSLCSRVSRRKWANGRLVRS